MAHGSATPPAPDATAAEATCATRAPPGVPAIDGVPPTPWRSWRIFTPNSNEAPVNRGLFDTAEQRDRSSAMSGLDERQRQRGSRLEVGFPPGRDGAFSAFSDHWRHATPTRLACGW